jgi:DNA polymerase
VAAVEPAGDSQRGSHIATLNWRALQESVSACTACGLAATRTKTVFGVGAQPADWMIVGEAPGAEEDARGEPFVGQAGQLLDAMLAAISLARGTLDEDPSTAAIASSSAARTKQSVYIANVLKCRPPANRNPSVAEVSQCAPYLLRQMALVQPRVLLLMGRFAAQAVLGGDATIASLRGKVHTVQMDGRACPAIVTYHPAYLLRSLGDKARAWEDLCLAVRTLQSGLASNNAEKN